MKKVISYNGEKIKVYFRKANFSRNISRYASPTLMVEAKGTNDFIINGKSYTVSWHMKRKEKASTTLSFEGFTCGDNEKKMIEHIVEKYGI